MNAVENQDMNFEKGTNNVFSAPVINTGEYSSDQSTYEKGVNVQRSTMEDGMFGILMDSAVGGVGFAANVLFNGAQAAGDLVEEMTLSKEEARNIHAKDMKLNKPSINNAFSVDVLQPSSSYGKSTQVQAMEAKAKTDRNKIVTNNIVRSMPKAA